MRLHIPQNKPAFEHKYSNFIPLLSFFMLQALILIPSWYVAYIRLQEGTGQTSWSLFSTCWISIDLILMVYIVLCIRSDSITRKVLPFFVTLTGFLWTYEIYAKLIQVLAHRQPMLYNDFFLINDALYLYADLFTSYWAILLLLTGLFGYILFKVIPEIWFVLSHTIRRYSSSTAPVFPGILLLAGIVALHQIQHTQLESAPAQLISGRLRDNVERSFLLYRRVHDPEYQKVLESQINRSFDTINFTPDIYIFVMESYGRILADRTTFHERYQTLMENVQSRLAENGWSIVTNFSHAPVSGSGSWLSDASLLSGININNQAIYDNVTSSAMLPFVRFFRENNYLTISLEPPSRHRPGLPLSNPYGFETHITFQDLAYQNIPFFGWGLIPDQYSLYMAESNWLEDRTQPLFFYFPMVTSHAPWTMKSIPPFVDPPADSAQFISAYVDFSHQNSQGENSEKVGKSTHLEHYFAAINYDFKVITNFLIHQNSGESIVIIMGDHQPPIISNGDDSYQTPVHILSTRKELLLPFHQYGFTNGLYKIPDAGDTLGHHQILQYLTDVLVMFSYSETD